MSSPGCPMNEHYERIDFVAPNFHLSACIEFQKSLFVRLTTDKNSEKFFKVFFERMTNAQNEIKSTVVPNTGDVMSRSTWNKSAHKEIEAPGLSSISPSFVFQVSVLVHFVHRFSLSLFFGLDGYYDSHCMILVLRTWLDFVLTALFIYDIFFPGHAHSHLTDDIKNELNTAANETNKVTLVFHIMIYLSIIKLVNLDISFHLVVLSIVVYMYFCIVNLSLCFAVMHMLFLCICSGDAGVESVTYRREGD